MSVLDKLRDVTPARETVTICLNAGLTRQHQALQVKIEEASRDDSLAQEKVLALAAEMDALRDRMLASQVTFEFERIEWSRRLEIRAEHPPRDDSPIDKYAGHNVKTYNIALIRESCVSVTDQDGSTSAVADIDDATWAGLFGDDDTKGALNQQQVTELVTAALVVNDVAPQVPISALSSLTTPANGESSEPPATGKSRRNGSKAGSRRGATKSTTTTTDDSLP